MIMVGVGGMARHHLRTMLKMRRNTSVVGCLIGSSGVGVLSPSFLLGCPAFMRLLF